MSRRSQLALAVTLAVFASTTLSTVSLNTLRWIGATFPGFLLVGNGVVASISLPEWELDDTSRLFQHQVLAVDGHVVQSPADLYAHVARRPAGTTSTYTLRSPTGDIHALSLPSRTFTNREYFFVFGAYLLTGIVFIATSLLVFMAKPANPTTYGFLSSCFTTGVFITTAADLYGPHWFFRVHIAAEALLGAGFMHLAFVFPTDRIRATPGRALALLYVPFLAFLAFYQWAATRPDLYTIAHLLASASHGAGAFVFLAAIVHDRVTTRSALVRSRITVVVLGALLGLAPAGLLMAGSALYGGSVPLNAAVFTALSFPLSLAYAMMKHDLFDIDVVVRQTLTYSFVVVVIAGLYLGIFSLIGTVGPVRALLQRSPLIMAMLNLLVLFAIAPVKSRVQSIVARTFFRQSYDVQDTLTRLGLALAHAHTFDAVHRTTEAALAAAFSPRRLRLYVLIPEASGARVHPLHLEALPPPLRVRLADGHVVSRYGADEHGPWLDPDADVLVPIRSGTDLVGVIGLGPKQSGRGYNSADRTFLTGVASHLALALTNASAFAQLTELNASLEEKVRMRTAELADANTELSRSLEEVRRGHESLRRSDRLATLGRLTAGIAHEVNTPLGAVLSELRVLDELGHEYQQSIDDGQVTPGDHREIAREILATTRAATNAARKAASFVSRVKTQGRDPHRRDGGTFRIATVVEETMALLAHRLRVAGGTIEFREEPTGLTATGEPGRLGQVVTNLVTNALDAYEDAGRADVRIAIVARERAGAIVITVRDWAGGMPPEVEAHAFDELFTTKEAGRGTGLGLWIARNVVEESFRGSLTLETTPGEGSTFTIVLASAPTAAQAPGQTPA